MRDQTRSTGTVPSTFADDGHSLAHADGTPFFWLGDTVWNGLIRSTADDWDEYLCTRRAQGFSVIQFFSTHGGPWTPTR